MTVTGTWLPSSPKIWVIPILRPISPSFRAINAPCRATSSDAPRATKSIGVASEFDFDVDAGRQVELHQRIHRLGRGIDDVQQPLVGAHLELLARRLVDVGAPQHGPAVDDRRQQ